PGRNGAEMRPIDLAPLTRQGGQTQIGFGLWTWTMAGDDVTEVIGAADIAALAHHAVEAAGGQLWELLQRCKDERQVGIDLRGPGMANARQAGLGQHPGNGAVVNVQLSGDGVGAPSLDVVVAQDLRLELS